MTEPQQSSPTIRCFPAGHRQPAKAGGTENLVRMLGDALTAKITPAGGTAGSRLPLPVIVATLVSDIRHGLINTDPVFWVNSLA